MSYNQFSRAPNGYQRSDHYFDGQQSYAQDGYGQQGYNQQPYDSYGYNRQHYPEDEYDTADPYYGSSNGRHHHYPSSYHSTRSRRHGPIIVGSSRTYGRYGSNVVYPSSRYQVISSSSRHAPVISGRSYRDDWTSIGTHIRRLFGLGPKQSSRHRGVAVHVTRGGTRSSGRSHYYGDKVYAI